MQHLKDLSLAAVIVWLSQLPMPSEALVAWVHLASLIVATSVGLLALFKAGCHGYRTLRRWI